MKNFTHVVLGLCLLLTPMAWAGEVNVNTADAQTIATELKGIGLNKAKAIVDYRDAHGRFETADDLTLVKGIGLRTVDINRDNIKTKFSKAK